jgi:peptide/nickel transport system ATP-binding protein
MAEPILAIEGLVVVARGDSGPRPLLHGISLQVGRERVALVGESGSGKSLTARAALGLLPRGLRVAAGRIGLGGEDVTNLPERRWTSLRGRVAGLVLQDPKFSLNPVQTVGRQVEEVLVLHGRAGAAERRRLALAMLARVGLDDPERVHASYPGALSGGMGQRVMIAVMLIGQPRLLIADEPTSALDQAIRDQVLDLIRDLAEERGMGVLLISHDLQQVARFADRVLVMRAGRIVDELRAADLATSGHPYTRALWQARPSAATYGTRLPVPDPAAPEASP